MRIFEKRLGALVAPAVVLILSVFSMMTSAQSGSQERSLKEREIYKTVLLYVAKQSKGGTAKDLLYFVSVNDGDPTEGFLEELKKSGLNVRKQSDLKIEDVFDKVQRDETTHMRSISLYVGNLQWLSETEVELRGGYWRGGRHSNGGDYYASYLVDRWKVTKFRQIILQSVE